MQIWLQILNLVSNTEILAPQLVGDTSEMVVFSHIFTMAFCLKGKAMVMRPPVSPGDVSNLRGCVRTSRVATEVE